MSAIEKEDNKDCEGPGGTMTTQANARTSTQTVCLIVAVSFGLLCLLQVTLNITLRLHYMVQNSKVEEERELLQINYTNLVKETDLLLMNYTDLIEERDLLLMNYTDLAEERDLLLTNYTDLAEERDLLLMNNSDLAADRAFCLTKYHNLSTEKQQLLTNYNHLAKRKRNLMSSYNNLVNEKNHLLTSYNNLANEKNQLQTSYNNLANMKNQLQTSYNNLANEKNQLVIERNRLNNKREQAGWISFQFSLYFISNEEAPWQESKLDCWQRGAELVVINNQEEQNFIESHLNHSWIGLTDIYQEGQWWWVDGTPITYSYWAANEPNDFLYNEDCAESRPYGWNDIQCSDHQRWICEKKM